MVVSCKGRRVNRAGEIESRNNPPDAWGRCVNRDGAWPDDQLGFPATMKDFGVRPRQSPSQRRSKMALFRRYTFERNCEVSGG